MAPKKKRATTESTELTTLQKKQRTKKTKKKKMTEMAACSGKPRVRIAPVCGLPEALITGMGPAGALVEEVEKGLYIVRVGGIDSEAWRLYEEWACYLGEVDPIVVVLVAPTP